MQVKAVFYLPLFDNDGRDLNSETETAEAELFARFDAWTFHGFTKGTYRLADGTTAIDESGWYSIVMDDSQLDELVLVLSEFKFKTLQEAIYLEIQRNIEMRYV